ncbi:hypothetical protein ACXR0O_09700 [Verrucomicrobiota bacterium sgz303538]
MKMRVILALSISVCVCGLGGCKDWKLPRTGTAESTSDGAVEHIDAAERAAAAKLKVANDPIQEEAYAFRVEVRQAYNNRQFDELEKRATALRAAKETFGNGSWKLAQFYAAFGCRDDEPESMWQLHDQIHKDWIAAKPASITARVAYADFLTEYAWRARGTGYANTVTQQGWQLFQQRMNAAHKVLVDARKLQEKDPYWWLVALQVARGEGWPKAQYDALVTEAKSVEPKFWGYHTERAFSLLPRWYGEEGDWETYAEQEAERPDGLGAEMYARIVMNLRGYHENIFRETKASWPKTREGLEQLRKKYPKSLEFVNQTAMLATVAQDRELAKEMFDQLGDNYMPSVWRKPERFAHYRNWANTGEW